MGLKGRGVSQLVKQVTSLMYETLLKKKIKRKVKPKLFHGDECYAECEDPYNTL